MKASEIVRLGVLDRSEFLRNSFKPVTTNTSRRSLVYGFGVNDSDYVVYKIIDGLAFRCAAYDCWKDMIRRAYSHSFHEKQPSYIGVNVCEEWSSFMKFRSWWIDHYVDGFEIDKDILTDNRLYSPDNCLFVPAWINGFVNDQERSRGKDPMGVSWRESVGKYQVRCSHPFKKRFSVGYFSDRHQAAAAWLETKIAVATELKSKMDAVDTRIYGGILRKIRQSASECQ